MARPHSPRSPPASGDPGGGPDCERRASAQGRGRGAHQVSLPGNGPVGAAGIPGREPEAAGGDLQETGMDFPPQWQNSLAAAYMNRGVALDSQGKLGATVEDYGLAILLREDVLFLQEFAPVIPGLAMSYYNVLLLGKRKDLPENFDRAEWCEQTARFLHGLEQMVDIQKLPKPWMAELEDLAKLLKEVSDE